MGSKILDDHVMSGKLKQATMLIEMATGIISTYQEENGTCYGDSWRSAAKSWLETKN